MNKSWLHHIWTHLRPIKSWYFLGLAVIFAVTAIFALRQNNLTAIRLRDEVIKTDEQNGDVETALRNLRQFVYSHMNTNLASGPNAIKPPIQLKYRYERLVQAEKDRVEAANAQLYTAAQAECERLHPESFSGGARVPCIQQYIAQHGGAQEKPIADSLYKFDFVSPGWSPDLAGWSIVLGGLFLFLFLLRFSVEHWLKRQFKRQA